MFDRRIPSTIRSALIAAIALLAISAGSVAADTTPAIGGTFTQHGTSADVFASTCEPGAADTTTCIEQGISAFTGKMTESVSGTRFRNQICVHRATYSYDGTGELVGEPTFEFGCVVDRPAGVVTIGKDLSSVTLATTTIEVSELVCDEFACEPGPSRDVTVRGTWTGVGPITASRSHSSFDDGTCRSRDSGKGSYRSASFVGTLDGQEVGDDPQAWITSGRFSYRTRCLEG
jgi:hypothetical protein